MERSEVDDTDWDALVAGAGYAGLSAALTLARARRSVLVVGDGEARNSSVPAMHGFLGHDGAAPGDILGAARRELDAYPSTLLVGGRVDAVEPVEGLLRVRVGHRVTIVGTAVVATGVHDDLPPVSGLAEHWGRGVHTCPYCDGWEHRDEPVAVIGPQGAAGLLARTVTGWTDHVLLFADISDAHAHDELERAGVVVDQRRVCRILGKEGSVSGVDLDDGSHVEVGAVFVAGTARPNNALARLLGCRLDEGGFVVVDAEGRTTVDGVWAAGDVTRPVKHQVAVAVADGVVAGRSCNARLLGLR